MPYVVRILSRAKFDAQQIYDWIKDRSPEGAVRWWTAFRDACHSLKQNPERQSLAIEAEQTGRDLRQLLFKTRRGRYYRLVYVIAGEEVHVLRVRGPGQPDLTPGELA
jgi:plasmid stabilization system protein ParE